MLTLCLITPGGLAILWRLLVPTGDQPGVRGMGTVTKAGLATEPFC